LGIDVAADGGDHPSIGPTPLPSLNDDCVGRCLDRLFDADVPTLGLAVVFPAVWPKPNIDAGGEFPSWVAEPESG
jgi:hypothetical protein